MQPWLRLSPHCAQATFLSARSPLKVRGDPRGCDGSVCQELTAGLAPPRHWRGHIRIWLNTPKAGGPYCHSPIRWVPLGNPCVEDARATPTSPPPPAGGGWANYGTKSRKKKKKHREKMVAIR